MFNLKFSANLNFFLRQSNHIAFEFCVKSTFKCLSQKLRDGKYSQTIIQTSLSRKKVLDLYTYRGVAFEIGF